MKVLLSRRWFVAHVVVAVAVATCVLAGRWQLRRLDDRRAANRLVSVRTALPALDEPASATEADPRSLEYRVASLEGTYDAERQVLLIGRVLAGRTGSHVLTPLRTRDGRAVLVDRGWVPQQAADPRSPPPAPPGGVVRVTGVLLPNERRGPSGSRAPAGELRAIASLDVGRLEKQLPYPVGPLALLLREQVPPPGPSDPKLAPLPPLSEGPHLGYAIQWFGFAAVFLAGYAILLRRPGPKRRPAA